MILVEHPNKKFMAEFDRYEPAIQDHTAMSVLKTCKRKYFLRIVLGRVFPKSQYQTVFDFGSAYHKFRELLETKGYQEAIGYILNVKLTPAEPNSKFAYLDNIRLLKSCQAAYDHWKKEKELNRIKVIAVEQPFNVQLPDGTFIGGRADQIVEWNGKLWGRDFKTTSKELSWFQRGLDPNDQATRYIYGESKLHGQQIEGIIFEAIYNTKTVGPKIYSALITKNKWQLDQWEREQVFNNRVLKTIREEDIWPMDDGYQCQFCDYAFVCRKSSEAAMVHELKSNYKLSPWDHSKVEQEDI